MVATIPDAFLTVSGPGDLALMTKQARELGFKGRLLYISSIADFDSFMSIAGEDPSQGMLGWFDDFTAPNLPPRIKEFQEFVTKVLQRPAGGIHLAAYLASMEILLQALEKASSLDTEKILQVLKTSEFDTMVGRVRFEGEKTFGVPRRINGIVRVGEIKGRRYFHAGEAIYREP
jgi:ABC-type branched-subunit amino acid transport system substrate-binding protein